ncbi:CHAT domain-containing protein [Amycolatopsis sp. cmx-8-4]|uniref:CHAT domain-containing protein n=1 Tax=Amycolatopsis sp. cmx-8-4 TaxID=2790947 RepID=UPI00397D7BAA
MADPEERHRSEKLLTSLHEVLTALDSSSDLADAKASRVIELLSRLSGLAASAEDHQSVKLMFDWWQWLNDPARSPATAELDESSDSKKESDVIQPIEIFPFYFELTRRGIECRKKFFMTGGAEYLDESVVHFRDAIYVASVDDKNFEDLVSNLGYSLIALGQWKDDVSALNEAVQRTREAVVNTLVGHERMAARMSNYAAALRELFLHGREISILEESIKSSRSAVNLVDKSDPERVGISAELFLSLYEFYRQNGDVETLEEAVSVARRVFIAESRDFEKRAERAGRLSDLATALQELFRWHGDSVMLRDATLMASDAARSTPRGHVDRAIRQSLHSAALRAQYSWGGEIGDLNYALEQSREAVNVVPRGHPQRMIVQAELSSALMAHFEVGRDEGMLEEAAQIAQDVVEATSRDNEHWPKYASSLGVILRSKAVLKEDLKILREAARFGADAVRGVRLGNPDRADILGELAVSLRLIFEWTGDIEFRDEARSHFAAAADLKSTPLHARLNFCRYAAELDLMAGEPGKALGIIERAVDLLPAVAARVVGRNDRQHRLATLAGLATTAAVAAIRSGDPNRAIELLEQTRGVTHADVMDTRTDIAKLEALAPTLAREFNVLRNSIEAARHQLKRTDWAVDGPYGSGRRAAYLELIDRRSGLNSSWLELLGRIRSIRGLHEFLRPLPIDKISEEASEGPIAYFFAHKQSGYALILAKDPIATVRIVELPNFTELAALKMVDLLENARVDAVNPSCAAADRVLAQQCILGVLGSIWEHVAEPILRNLNYLSSPKSGQPWPRIWWCPVGVAASLPVHAAGYHPMVQEVDENATVMDRVASSYTSTVRALAHVRMLRRVAAEMNSNAGVEGENSMLIVAVADAPRTEVLAGVADEVALIRELVPRATVIPSAGNEVTLELVTEMMNKYRIIHLACHGIADGIIPARSYLVLHDHLMAPLTVAEIARLKLENGELAYLSACSTTTTNSGHLDEATNIATSLQMAGYRNVIGSIWPINDRGSTDIAEKFYDLLTSGGARYPEVRDVAAALHGAVRHQRNRYPLLPTRWSSVVHAGE